MIMMDGRRPVQSVIPRNIANNVRPPGSCRRSRVTLEALYVPQACAYILAGQEVGKSGIVLKF